MQADNIWDPNGKQWTLLWSFNECANNFNTKLTRHGRIHGGRAVLG